MSHQHAESPEDPFDRKRFDLDFSKNSKFNSNFWVLCVFAVGLVIGVSLLRDLQENDRTAKKEQLAQEKHFEFSDARLDLLEKRTVATERFLEGINIKIDFLVEDRRESKRRKETNP